ncbi:hemerythrin domain-containing protein [Actinocatenispora rupis]|uniref:Hemerythrin HHE cation binding domain-containing protein n=1 Tax=Actinocatenispora rupis TaxID=519421 RepID=A0A8J3NBC4_9ACTN|nr:hemerythrin domain-containing protein [Actinocatenispora rupis]GID12921.1 hypothetical protein Aru02nite_38100 [Actinocatenispora rupis]
MATTAPRRSSTDADLYARIRDFEEAVGAPAGPGWRNRAAGTLDALREAFSAHVAASEGPGGRYAELVAAAPRLAGPVERLLREHPRIGVDLADLARVLAETATTRPPVGAAVALRTIDRHHRRGTDLLYEAYVIDLGGET